ncbi:substrate-binding domain-containing protein [Roseospira goensis]|uniref:Molybdate transport system substrate-binding protein n=1 Tax=Roseospira goensis TaxID=391922 RepID=A0A7W6S043_9PROT|nr:substrate-binding domain-containing protein [Roseospira goensis]MBB4285762.1 molybdate transport system substrate-binding protein [Roseospira goensis]
MRLPSAVSALAAAARHRVVCIGLLMMLALPGCDASDTRTASDDPTPLLIYCGVTMLHPIRAIAEVFEAETGVPVVISQGASADLYRSLETARLGDMYFPGSLSYRIDNLHAGLLGEGAHVGYNVAALLVRAGNPKRIPASLAALTDPALAVVVANPDSGSIGRETRRILRLAGLYDAVLRNTVLMATDSRNLNQALLDGSADVVLNWRATGRFPENQPHVEVLDIDPALAARKKLVINLLTFSQQPALARRFMKMATSPRGQAIFRDAGFIDARGRTG